MKKTYVKKSNKWRVTFELPADAKAQKASVCGEFNDWDKTKHELVRRKQGNFSITVSLDAGKEYRFRYWVDDDRWENDWAADKYVPNEFGSEDSVVVL